MSLQFSNVDHLSLHQSSAQFALWVSATRSVHLSVEERLLVLGLAGTAAARYQGRRPRYPCPVFEKRPGLAVAPLEGIWHQSNPPIHVCPVVVWASSQRTQSFKEGTGTSTSTNCSASCAAWSGAPCGMVSSRVIVGTSITCSATTGSVTKNLTTSDNWPTICGTRTKDSMIGPTVCRFTRRCAKGPRLDLTAPRLRAHRR